MGKLVRGPTVAPCTDAALLLDALAEDEAEEHVQAADGEDEERGDEGEFVDVVGEDGCAEEALDDTERAEAEGTAEHGEEDVEELLGPPDLGHDAHDALEDDQEAVQNGPKRARRLVRYGAASAHDR